MTAETGAHVAEPPDRRRLRVGVHANNLHLRLARAIAGLNGNCRFDFVDYRDGRGTAALIRAGTIDVGGTGSTPPIVAQGEGDEVVYLAASQPRPANGALLVVDNGRVLSPADLTGRRIALIEGSFHTYLLAHLAERAGLRLADFERVDLSPVHSATALREGGVAAWIAMDPHLPSELAKGGLAVLPGSKGVVPNRSLFWTVASVAAAAADELTGLLTLLSDVAPFIAERAQAAAEALAKSGDATPEQWLAVLRSRDWTLSNVDAAILDEQQREADCLSRHGVLRGPLDLRASEPLPPRAKSSRIPIEASA